MTKSPKIPSYEQYIKDVLSGKIKTCQYVRQAVERFERMRKDKRYTFDSKCVDDAIDFVAQLKHFAGKAAGNRFILEPWEAFIFAAILGIKYKDSGLRVCRTVYLQMARKQGKTSLIAALALYMLIADGEASPEIACLATSREQAHLCFDFITKYAKSIDPKGDVLDYYRNYVSFEDNNGTCKVFSSDSAKLDGLSISCGILDEYAAQPNNLLYNVIRSSMAYRSQPLLFLITTPQFSLSSPAYQTYLTSIEILAGVKEEDSFLPLIYTLDADDKWDEPENWIKSNPNLGVTVSEEFIKGEVQNAKNDPTQLVPVQIKTIGIWTDTESTWIPRENIVKVMEKVDFSNYVGMPVYIGVDLSAVQDLTALSMMIPIAGNKKYIFKTWHWLPRETFENSPNRELYRQFVQEGTLILTDGNVVDYDAVISKMQEIKENFQIIKVGYDKWNATAWALDCVNLGFPMEEFSQAIGNFNNPTKEFAKLVLGEECIIDKSRAIAYEMGNVVIKTDPNGNQKPSKESVKNKIDGIIAMLTALGIYLKENQETDFELFII